MLIPAVEVAEDVCGESGTLSFEGGLHDDGLSAHTNVLLEQVHQG